METNNLQNNIVTERKTKLKFIIKTMLSLLVIFVVVVFIFSINIERQKDNNLSKETFNQMMLGGIANDEKEDQENIAVNTVRRECMKKAIANNEDPDIYIGKCIDLAVKYRNDNFPATFLTQEN